MLYIPLTLNSGACQSYVFVSNTNLTQDKDISHGLCVFIIALQGHGMGDAAKAINFTEDIIGEAIFLGYWSSGDDLKENHLRVKLSLS